MTPQPGPKSGRKQPRKPPQRVAQKMARFVPPAAEQETDPAAVAAAKAAKAAAKAAAEPTGPPPLRLTAAAVIAALEGLAVAAWGVILLFSGTARDAGAGAVVLLFAAIPLGAAYGLRRARRWSRGPALIMQLLSLPIAWTMLHSTGAVIAGGAALGALALGGLVLLVHPATTDALGISRTAS